jgi:predicted acetyltransferase
LSVDQLLVDQLPWSHIFPVLVCCIKKNLAARQRAEAMHWNLEKETFEES